mmetsp:Transcript_90374/g.165491  ORF Transcript_90374/g.165491 Transcript_90374/m.165491 type:complete len:278 (+) Transcript_90374:90-923(+)
MVEIYPGHGWFGAIYYSSMGLAQYLLYLLNPSGDLTPAVRQAALPSVAPMMAVGYYYYVKRCDREFMTATAYGRLVTGGICIPIGIFLNVLPPALWCAWAGDVIPALICLWFMRQAGETVNSDEDVALISHEVKSSTTEIRTCHGWFGGIYYFCVGLVTWLLYLLNPLGDIPMAVRAVALPSCAPMMAVGCYYILMRADREFMTATVFGRLVTGGIGVPVGIFAHVLPMEQWGAFAGDVVPALICWWFMDEASNTSSGRDEAQNLVEHDNQEVANKI